MRRLLFTPTALTDLVTIQDYITCSSRQITVAEHFISKLTDYCQHLATLPGLMGSARPELMPNLRSVVYGNYVLFLRYPDDTLLEIIHIIEGHRDINAFFANQIAKRQIEAT
jgi:toxin ParE1/3/4